jgi:hypothetical protein
MPGIDGRHVRISLKGEVSGHKGISDEGAVLSLEASDSAGRDLNPYSLSAERF